MPLPDRFLHLLAPAAYPHPAAEVRLIETHISWVLLAGDHAYKIKKPVDFGFLDFSSLEKRRVCCEEEIRLNRRLAPGIYLGVVPVTATGIGHAGDVLDWAVHMHAFPPDATLDREPVITALQIDAIADRVAAFHGDIACASADGPHGTPVAVLAPVRENLCQIAALTAAPPEQISRLTDWVETSAQRLDTHFAARLASGFVRECHGDLHLGNIAWHEAAPIIFDCIEFNADLRFVDVVSEVAFLCMDLVAREQAGLAWRFLNRYLEHTGDYAGLAALPFYLVYRALVRAKVAALRSSQGDTGSTAEWARYLDLAERLSQPGRPRLILMHGYSGAGKSWLSQQLLEALGAIRLRSDVERKRLFGLAPLARSQPVAGDIYGPEASQRTFSRLQNLAGELLDAGFPVIVDATFLGRRQRENFSRLAETRGMDWRLVSLSVAPEILRDRITHRQSRADDASEADLAVLESQMRNAEPLDERESAHCIPVTGAEDVESVLVGLRAAPSAST